jgi:sigma54-dependent transcription regulator
MKILFTWVGQQDLKAIDKTDEAGNGPICNALDARDFDRVRIFNNYSADQYSPETVARYLDWLNVRSSAELELINVPLSDPTDLEAIYKAVNSSVEQCLAECEEIAEVTFHLSPGTWAMATVWCLLSQTRFAAELIQSSREAGVQTVDLPFDIYAELVGPADKRLAQLSMAAGSWGDSEFRSAGMARLLQKAGKAASRRVPVLVLGEAGTEKASLARLIHDTGPRKDGPFRTVNCSLLSGAGKDALSGTAGLPGSLP